MRSQFMKRKATISGLVAVLVVAVALVAWDRRSDSQLNVSTQVLGAQLVQTSANANSNGSGATNGNGGDPKGSFTVAGQAAGLYPVAGQAAGLYPGAVVALPLTLTNPQSFGITVTELSVAVQSPSLACVSGVVEVGVLDSNGHFKVQNPVPVSVTLGKNGSLSLSDKVQLHMVTSSPDACQGVAFSLSYGGSAVKS